MTTAQMMDSMISFSMRFNGYNHYFGRFLFFFSTLLIISSVFWFCIIFSVYRRNLLLQIDCHIHFLLFLFFFFASASLFFAKRLLKHSVYCQYYCYWNIFSMIITVTHTQIRKNKTKTAAQPWAIMNLGSFLLLLILGRACKSFYLAVFFLLFSTHFTQERNE